ncbi:tetratricopeptide repeat protein [Tuwongella immobilis]|uniref:Sporulation domain-containing protein n=1 Tax=Tuwongella immobilis TaxID=692036 RepID=A0A6C2YJD0_9BACT|nr:hypothetical protein [Tuwongella immobilis]VIP01215.1 sporulation domain-containing protein : [Tuwongella immobilis]VTR97856.1 sporulation domain-containing protein : [Tuwongella immobilis]
MRRRRFIGGMLALALLGTIGWLMLGTRTVPEPPIVFAPEQLPPNFRDLGTQLDPVPESIVARIEAFRAALRQGTRHTDAGNAVDLPADAFWNPNRILREFNRYHPLDSLEPDVRESLRTTLQSEIRIINQELNTQVRPRSVPTFGIRWIDRDRYGVVFTRWSDERRATVSLPLAIWMIRLQDTWEITEIEYLSTGERLSLRAHLIWRELFHQPGASIARIERIQEESERDQLCQNLLHQGRFADCESLLLDLERTMLPAELRAIALHVRAQCRLARLELALAEADLDEADRHWPGNEAFQITRARLKLAQKQPTAAREILESALAQLGDDPMLVALRGQSLAAEQNWSRAEPELRRALDAAPQLPDALDALRACLNARNADRAELGTRLMTMPNPEIALPRLIETALEATDNASIAVYLNRFQTSQPESATGHAEALRVELRTRPAAEQAAAIQRTWDKLSKSSQIELLLALVPEWQRSPQLIAWFSAIPASAKPLAFDLLAQPLLDDAKRLRQLIDAERAAVPDDPIIDFYEGCLSRIDSDWSTALTHFRRYRDAKVSDPRLMSKQRVAAAQVVRCLAHQNNRPEAELALKELAERFPPLDPRMTLLIPAIFRDEPGIRTALDQLKARGIDPATYLSDIDLEHLEPLIRDPNGKLAPAAPPAESTPAPDRSK